MTCSPSHKGDINVFTKAESITAAALMQRRLSPPRFTVSNLLPEGLTICAAKPKTGKSWWALAASIAVSNGTEFMGIGVNQGEVLYLALEDTLQRLRSRVEVLCKEDIPSDDLHFQIDFPRIGDGFIDELSSWLAAHRRCRLVVIDTLGRVSPRGGKSTYAAEYETLAELKALADRSRTAILIIHHLRKTSAGNWTDEIQGSSAVSGAADALLHLSRPRNNGQAVLNITGRDIEEREVHLQFDSKQGRWAIVGEGHRDFLSPERRRILTFLESQRAPVNPKLVSDARGLNPHSTRKVMARMCNQRLLARTVGGYVPSITPDHGSVGSLGSPDNGDEAPRDGTVIQAPH